MKKTAKNMFYYKDGRVVEIAVPEITQDGFFDWARKVKLWNSKKTALLFALGVAAETRKKLTEEIIKLDDMIREELS